MAVFKNPLTELIDYESFTEAFLKGKEPVGICGCIDSEKVHFMSTFLESRDYQLIVTYNEQRAREICEDYKLFTQNVCYFPPKDLIFFQADIQNNTITTERMKAIRQVIGGKGGVIVTTLDALMNRMTPPEAILEGVLQLTREDLIDPDEICQKLVMNGYQRTAMVEEPGQFSLRGGILDIYSLTEEMPARIELFGDEIDSIRYFDAVSQRSVENTDEITFYPASELVLTSAGSLRGMERIAAELKKQTEYFKKRMEGEKALRLQKDTELFLEGLRSGTMLISPDAYLPYFYERTDSFLDYFPTGQTLIFLDEPMRLEERGNGIFAEFEESMKNRLEQGYLLPGQISILSGVKETFDLMDRGQTASLSSLDNRFGMVGAKNIFSITVQNMNSYKNSFDMLIKDLKQWKKEKYRVVLLCPSKTRGMRIAGELQEEGLISYYNKEDTEKEVLPGEIMVAAGNLHRGFLYPMLKYAVITDGDIFGTKKKKRERKSEYEGKKIVDFGDLKPGDYVVHEKYGLGIYKGTEKQVVDRATKDFIKIEYGDGGNLYIPVTQLQMIQKYADKTASVPKLNRLSGNDWTRTKSRVQKAVAGIAKELVELYALRQEEKGYCYSPDTLWQQEFEELFPFEETDDQLKAIADTKKDMESSRIMDRLICGDVGFGKTEIAIRAAFKAVQDSKQVVYLVPTTILAQQHFNSFVQRMKDYPVKVALLSRFRTAAQIRKTLLDLKKGLVDIVIGTHRVLSKDVEFKNLGLLIIDEEQRFGVTHKEKIKQMKKTVDVLTLTATPIPRTLHMSLIGVRDMSVLEEAPIDRKPIQTYVMELNWEMVREAINRELAREGQVYYVYNRTKDIDEVAARISKLVPDANVAYAHGQMNERQMEQIMMDFVNGDIDVLVSTTIIETGLDIPNVNTIIIHDSDRYGLSQLYQLRGRVGRSSRTAYAFVLYQTGKLLKEIAEKRLQAIREYTALGSGIRIAMRDLEIRGAGNLLGSEQHGHMEAVGYDLYCKMLKEAVGKERGELREEELFDTAVEFPVSAYIPDSYIRNDSMKMDIYKRIAAVESEKESLELTDELIDRFGDVPRTVMNLIDISTMRNLAHSAYLTEIKADLKTARFYAHPKAPYLTDRIPGLIQDYRGALRLIPGETPCFILTAGNGKIRDKEFTIPMIRTFLEDLKQTLLYEPEKKEEQAAGLSPAAALAGRKEEGSP